MGWWLGGMEVGGLSGMVAWWDGSWWLEWDGREQKVGEAGM